MPTCHFTQTRMFYISQSDVEQEHMVNALRFELSKVNGAYRHWSRGPKAGRKPNVPA